MFQQTRAGGSISGPKKDFVKDYKHMTKLEDIVEDLKPTVLIGILL